MRLYHSVYSIRLPNGQCEQRQAPKWSIDYRDLLGRQRSIALSTNREAARRAADKFLELLELARAGMTIPPADIPPLVRRRFYEDLRAAGHKQALGDQASKRLTDHLDDWRADMLADGNTVAHTDQQQRRVQRIFAAIGAERWADLDEHEIKKALPKLRHPGRHQKNPRPLSIQTRNAYVQALQQFCSWMVPRRAPSNPLTDLVPQNANKDRRHGRRAMSAEEVSLIIQAAERGPVRYGLTGYQRALLYRAAYHTGLRSNELRTLVVGDFSLDHDPPFVRVRASNTKSGREDVLPLDPELVTLLRADYTNRRPDDAAFKMPHKCSVVRMLRDDMSDAKAAHRPRRGSIIPVGFLEYEHDGRFADFHSLRKSMITGLARAGAHPRDIQQLARHASFQTTMQIYTDEKRASELVAPLALLPALSTKPKRRTRQKRTSRAR